MIDEKKQVEVTQPTEEKIYSANDLGTSIEGVQVSKVDIQDKEIVITKALILDSTFEKKSKISTDELNKYAIFQFYKTADKKREPYSCTGGEVITAKLSRAIAEGKLPAKGKIVLVKEKYWDFTA